MNAIQPLLSNAHAIRDHQSQDEQLRQIAEEFEAVLTAAMLKEGLKSATRSGMDGEENADTTYMDMTCEQLATFIGRQGVLGIADQIVDNLTEKGSLNQND